jgi:putative ABC transport system permease protein
MSGAQGPRDSTGAPLDPTRAERLREDHEFDAEIEAHLAHRVDDLVSEGRSEEEAMSQARAEFGDSERIRAESRDVRDRARTRTRAPVWESARQDLAYALRQLRHGPAFAVTAVLTLMLGVGATVTIASVVQAVVFEPLPFTDPERVVLPEMLSPEGQRYSIAEAAFLDWRRDVRSFDAVAALEYRGGTIRSPGQPRTVGVARVSHDLLVVLGLEPSLGRAFLEEDDLPGAPSAVALLSYPSWRTDFGADPTVIGTTLDLDGRTYEIIGVMPELLDVLTGRVPVFVPLGADPNRDREDHYLDVVARLAPGVTLESASADLKEVQQRMSERHGADLGWSTHILTVRSELIGDTVQRGGWILLVAAGVLLVMACVNVSNLLMVRATVRRTEMAVRMAIGASRARLVRQLFTESALLAAGGGLLGLLLTTVAVPVVRSLGAARIPRLEYAQVDGIALAAGLLTVILATLACGVAPAVQLRSNRLGGSIAGVRRGANDPGRRIRSVLVAGQVALTVVLLSGTGLLLRSFIELTSVDPGFEAEGTLAFSVNMPDDSWSWEERALLLPELREALTSLPGVAAVGATAVAPFSGSGLANFVAPESRMPDRASDFTPIHWRPVTPGFFDAMGMELLAGRDFYADDGWENGTPIVIGRSLATLSWGNEDPIGRSMVWGDPQGSRMTVVGVVEDLRDVELGVVPPMIVYRPYRQIPWAAMTMVMRFDGDASVVAAGIRPRILEAAPGLVIGDIASLEENLQIAVAEPRFNLQILGGFAVAGLMLALIGLYGLTAFDVRRRFPEIGIRLSLGASPRSILGLVLKARLRLTLLGVAAGLALAPFVSRAIGTLLYEIEPTDPLTWAGVVLLVIATSLGATYVPASAAMRVDPREVLGGE